MANEELDDKIRIFNFEALKGTIEHHPIFIGAVKTFRRYANTAPKEFAEVTEDFKNEAEMLKEDIGVAGMTPEELLEDILAHIDKLPPEEQKRYLDKIAKVRERKRIIEEALLQAVLQNKPPPPKDQKALSALVQSGKISGTEIKQLGDTISETSRDFNRAYEAALAALKDGMRDIDKGVRTLQ